MLIQVAVVPDERNPILRNNGQVFRLLDSYRINEVKKAFARKCSRRINTLPFPFISDISWNKKKNPTLMHPPDGWVSVVDVTGA